MSHGTMYVSGPIMYADADAEDQFKKWSKTLALLDWDPIDPRDIPAKCGGACITLPHEDEKGMAHSWKCFLRYDLMAMLKCDGVFMIPGWHDSHGARLEMQTAVACGIPVYTNLGDSIIARIA